MIPWGDLPATPLVNMFHETGRSTTPPLPFPVPQWVDNQLVSPFNAMFWGNTPSVGIDRSEHEYLSGLQSLLNCPSKITLARSFRGAQAQMTINFLDQVS